MALLAIHLQDGFQNDTVVVEVSGSEVYRRDDVSTRMQLGLADIHEMDLPDRAVTVAIRLPAKGIERQVDISPSRPTYLAVSLTQNKLEIQSGTEPLGYV